MPRARKAPAPGGTRAGAPGALYANRTDLNANKNLPARVATNQTYGKAQQQLQAQRTVPMAPGPGILTRPGTVQASPAPPSGTMPGVPSPAPGMAPGAMGPLNRPTERPGEPVTAGINQGAGPGTEALPPGLMQGNANRLSDTLSSLARSSGSPALAQLAARAAAVGQ